MKVGSYDLSTVVKKIAELRIPKSKEATHFSIQICSEMHDYHAMSSKESPFFDKSKRSENIVKVSVNFFFTFDKGEKSIT